MILLDDAKVAAFLVELSALSRKHQIVIFGCGCCGSPSLKDLTDFKCSPDGKYVYDEWLEWKNADGVSK